MKFLTILYFVFISCSYVNIKLNMQITLFTTNKKRVQLRLNKWIRVLNSQIKKNPWTHYKIFTKDTVRNYLRNNRKRLEMRKKNKRTTVELERRNYDTTKYAVKKFQRTNTWEWTNTVPIIDIHYQYWITYCLYRVCAFFFLKSP